MVEVVKTEPGKEETVKDFVAFDMPQNALRRVMDVFIKGLKRSSSDDAEVLVYVTEDGLRFAGVNGGHTVMCIAYINRGMTNNFRFSRDHTFGMDLKKARSVLLYVKDQNAMVHFVQNDDMITIAGADGFTKTFPVLEDASVIKVPSIGYDNGGVVEAAALYSAVNMASDVNEHVKLTGDGNTLVVSAVRDQEKKTTIEIPVKVLNGKFAGEHSTFDAELLLPVLGALKPYDIMVRLKIEKKDRSITTMPMKISFKTKDNGIKGYVLMAPLAEPD